MTAPAPYIRLTSFTGSSPYTDASLGVNMDNEFNAVQVAVNAIEASLALIQRNDGALMNGSVTPDQLGGGLTISTILTYVPSLGVNAANITPNVFTAGGPSSLFTNVPGGTDCRLIVSKAAASHTASLLLQDNFSGHAEIGLCGDDNLHLRVSADGVTFIDALDISQTGVVTTTTPGSTDNSTRLATTAFVATNFASNLNPTFTGTTTTTTLIASSLAVTSGITAASVAATTVSTTGLLSTTNGLSITGGTLTATLLAPTWTTLTTIYQPAIFNLGGLPASAMDAHSAGAIGMPLALTAAIDIPSTFTPSGGFVSAGLAGYARTASTTAAAVGIFGVGMANAAGTENWGLNTIATNAPSTIPATQTGLNGVTCYGIEADVNIRLLPGGGTPTGTCRGLAIFGGSEVVPSGGAYALEIGSFSQTAQNTVAWTGGLIIDDAPNGFGISIGASAYLTNNVPSQTLQFVSRTSGGGVNIGTIQQSATGDLVYTAVSGHNVFSSSIIIPPVTIANLPASPVSGQLAYVHDGAGTAPTFHGHVVTGAVTVDGPVFYNITAAQWQWS